ncbi:MAG: hypothetical protein Q8K45_11605 [Rubrivivax sp.]|nr:hypothetical protein [Rubrivivax sp.]
MASSTASSSGRLAQARAEWRTNARLRLGLWLVLGIVWLYALLSASDLVAAQRTAARQGAEDLTRLRSIAAQSIWYERATQARQQLDALQDMAWVEPERALAEAALQDWVTVLAGKIGIALRERNLLRAEAAAPRPADAGSAPRVAELPAAYSTLRMRLAFEFTPASLVSLLNELAQTERWVRVDRLRVLQTGKPAIVELELAAVALRAPGRQP